MRKIITLFVSIFIIMCCVFPVFASAPSVVDEADYLTDDEEIALTEKLDEIRDEHNFDIAVVIVETYSQSNAEAAADDYYDYNGYGYNDTYDGIMLFVSENPRDYHFTTSGAGIDKFSDGEIENLKSQVQPLLSGGQYYNAFDKFAELAEYRLANNIDDLESTASNRGTLSNTGTSSRETGNRPVSQESNALLLSLIVIFPLIIALITIIVMAMGMNTASKNSNANNYVKKDSFKLDSTKDIFLYSRVTKQAKPKETSSSSGSSTHSSSSGRSHGGGGGSY